MGVQIVQHYHTLLCLWKKLIDQIAHALCKINPSPAFRHSDVSPTSQGLEEHKEIARSVAPIFIVETLRATWLGRQRLASLGNQLNDMLIETNLWTFGIIGSGIDVQYVLHVPDKLGAHRRNAPFLSYSKFSPLFFAL